MVYFSWCSLLLGGCCCSQPKSSACMLDLQCLRDITSTTVKAETPFLQVTRAGAKSLLKRSMDPLSVNSSCAYVQLNASKGVDFDKEEDPFPYICILLRYLGSPSHFLTCEVINGNMKSTSSNTLSEQNFLNWMPNNKTHKKVGSGGLVLIIRPYLKFTIWSERELSMHPCCLHSFSSKRWTWTSSDRTQVNVYLSPFLSSWKFALHPGLKLLDSTLSLSSLLFVACPTIEQQSD